MTGRNEDHVEAAAILRRILTAVEAGDIDASSAHGRAMLRRMEGAIAAWEASATPNDDDEDA